MSTTAQYKEYNKRLNKENAALKKRVEQLEQFEKQNVVLRKQIQEMMKEKYSTQNKKPNIFSRIVKFFTFKIILIFPIITNFLIL